MKRVMIRFLLAVPIMVAGVLLVASGCGDDDNPTGNGGGPNYGSPNGEYNVTSSNVTVTIDDWGTVPELIRPFVQQWINDLVDNGGSSEADVTQNLLLLLKTESPVCVAAPYVYDEDARSCTTPVSIDVEEFDASSMGLCETVPPDDEHCIQTVSMNGELTPNLVWTSNFATFSGGEALGSQQDPVGVTVVVSGNAFGGTYNLQFHASRDVSGTRCDNCAACPESPLGPGPSGDWAVTSANVSVTVTDSDLPELIYDLIEGWIGDVISNGGSSEWKVAQAAVVLSRVETDMCAPMVYAYNPLTRSCTITTPVNITGVDVSALGICETYPLIGEHCLSKISLTADFTPDLQWMSDFESFTGTERIGSASVPATATVTITGGTLAGDYNVDFFSVRGVSGSRCTSCSPCR